MRWHNSNGSEHRVAGNSVLLAIALSTGATVNVTTLLLYDTGKVRVGGDKCLNGHRRSPLGLSCSLGMQPTPASPTTCYGLRTESRNSWSRYGQRSLPIPGGRGAWRILFARRDDTSSLCDILQQRFDRRPVHPDTWHLPASDRRLWVSLG